MKIFLTICSKSKNLSDESLPAYHRYTSERIADVKKIADNEQTPFYILSGVYGLVKDADIVPYYNHLLLENEIEALSKKVVGQIKNLDITEIIFYTKSKETVGWAPYVEVIKNATKETNTLLTMRALI